MKKARRARIREEKRGRDRTPIDIGAKGEKGKAGIIITFIQRIPANRFLEETIESWHPIHDGLDIERGVRAGVSGCGCDFGAEGGGNCGALGEFQEGEVEVLWI